jgi:hypothetical protein
VTEIDQQSQYLAGSFQVIDDLGAVFVAQVLCRLDFHDDFIETEKIRLISLFEGFRFVAQFQLGMLDKWDALISELHCQAFLIDRFQESVSQLIVDFETGSNDLEAFFLEQDFGFHSFNSRNS